MDCSEVARSYDLLLVFHSEHSRQDRVHIACIEFHVVVGQIGLPFVNKFALELVFGQVSDDALRSERQLLYVHSLRYAFAHCL